MQNTPSANLESSQSLRTLLRQITGSISVYTAAFLIVRLLEFVLIPVYWSVLSPQDFGVLAVVSIIMEFLRSILGFGLPESITRYYHEWTVKEAPNHIGAIWTITWLSSLLLCSLLVFFAAPFFDVLIVQVPFNPYLSLAIWAALATSMSQIPLMTFRIMEKSRLYSICSILAGIFNIGLALYLVLVIQRGVIGILQAQLYSGIIMVVVYIVLMLRLSKPNLHYKYWRGVVAFSLPLVPSKLFEATANNMDRFLLEKFIPLNTLGLYQVARNLGRSIEVLTYGALTSWIPFQMRVLKTNKVTGREQVGRMATFIIFAIVFAAAGLALLGPDLIILIDIEDYLAVTQLLPIAVIAPALLGIVNIVIQGYIIAKKTQYAWLRTGGKLLITIAANSLLIPLWGVYGAFTATILATLANGIIGYTLSQRFYPMPFEWRKIYTISLSAIGLVLLGTAAFATPNVIINLILKSVSLLIYAVTMIGSILFRQQLDDYLKSRTSFTKSQ